MSSSRQSWDEAAERLAARIRSESGAPDREPPSKVAQGLVLAVEEHRLPGSIRGVSVVGVPRILVAPEAYQPRREFVIAHELAEHYLIERLPAAVHERFCDRVAAGLVLPRGAFLADLAGYRFELPALRRAWPWAAWETICWRTAELMPGVVAGKWVDAKAIDRRCSGRLYEVSPAEAGAIREAQKHWRAVVLIGHCVAAAWRVPGRGAGYRAVSLAFPA